MHVTMQDLHEPGTVWPQVMTPDGGTIDLGLLAAGQYQVDAVMHMIPWYGGPAHPFDAGSASFVVVPEPASVSVLALGGLALLRRRR